MHTLLVIMALAMAIVSVQAMAPGCINEEGNIVDWWVIIKMPNGHQYLYASSDDVHANISDFKAPSHGLDDPSSALGQTLTQIYSNKGASNIGYFAYNDQTPGKTSSTNGHAKGVVEFTKDGGFWLVHSLPLFADLSASSFNMGSNSQNYGQSFLCMTLGFDQLDIVGQQLAYYRPLLFGDSNFPSTLTSSLPNLYSVFQGNYNADSASNIAPLTVGGYQFVSFAKTAKWGQDVYGDLIGPHFQSSLLVESWMRPFEASEYPPNVSYEVINVNTLNSAVLGTTWKETQDHSKWAISIFPSKSIVCIGGINKQTSQWKRAGGSVCQQNPHLHRLFNQMVDYSTLEKYTPCSGSQCVYPY